MQEAQFLRQPNSDGRYSSELHETSPTWIPTPITPSHDGLMTPNDSDGDRSPMKQHRVHQQVDEIDNTSPQQTEAGTLHWKAPVAMVAYLLFGIGFALGHHFYWNSLDGTLVPSDTDQEWSSRAGIAAAFLAQSALCLAVGAAYTQRIWVTVKQKPMTLSGLDKVFSLQSDIFSFLSTEVLSKATFLCLLGLCAWFVLRDPRLENKSIYLTTNSLGASRFPRRSHQPHCPCDLAW